jgi:hypothetical protein
MLMRCACDKESCEAIAKFGITNGRLKIGFTGPTDHFVVDADFMMTVARRRGIGRASAGQLGG